MFYSRILVRFFPYPDSWKVGCSCLTGADVLPIFSGGWFSCACRYVGRPSKD